MTKIKSLFEVVDKVEELPPAPMPKMVSRPVRKEGRLVNIAVPRRTKCT